MTLAASPAEKTRDDRLAIVLDALLKQQAAGASVDFADVGRQHPDLVDEIKQLLAVGQMIDFVKSSPTKTTTLPNAGPSAPNNFIQLPSTFGDYELLAEIGRGGMGIVYKAWDKKLQRHVALKMILRGVHATAADLGRFRSEAQAAGGLTHPNIVPIYQVGEQNGQAYFCMKFVEGKTLAGVMADKPMHPREAAQHMIAIARAVQHAHDKGILHRDLKPSNILIDDNQQPLVTDFGLAKRVEGGESLTGTGAIVGTPSYMAPEQAEGTKTPTPSSDVYSLGAILYELLTGRPPFLAASAVETLLLVRSEEPVRPRALNPQIDVDLEFICRKCLEKSPEHRYASAAKLADDLEAFLHGEPVSARSSSLVYFFSRHSARDASRGRAGKLGHALDVAQPEDLFALRGHQCHVLLGNPLAFAVHGPVEHRPRRLGRDLLEPAPPRRAGHIRRTANRPRLGGRRRRLDRRLHRRGAARPSRVDLDAGDRRRRGDGVSREGGHALGLVLHRRRPDVS